MSEQSGESRTLSGLGAIFGGSASGQTAKDITNTIGTTSVVISGPNEARTELFVVNDSLNVIYLFLGTPAVANQGIRLNPSGGSFELNFINMWYGSVSAIATAASSVLCGVEVSQYAGSIRKPR